jgi:carbamoyl-phosphate synthase small subunit
MSDQLLPGVTGVLVLADGTVLQGIGCGHEGSALGEVVFNTAMTGYQEILTDPSYMQQILAFTFPHIGNVGVNVEDVEQVSGGGAETAAVGAIFRDVPTDPANWRADADLDTWMKRRNVVGLAGVDTRALTARIRDAGAPHGVIAHDPNGRLRYSGPGRTGAQLVRPGGPGSGQTGLDAPGLRLGSGAVGLARGLSARGCRRQVGGGRRLWRQAQHPARPGLDRREDHRRPGRPPRPKTFWRATRTAWSCPTGRAIRRRPVNTPCRRSKKLVDSGKPVFGICLGHQMLAIALGARTIKMDQGHHGANHPVKDLTTGKVEIVSMNHGFTVDRDSLPDAVEETHVSLFDGTNCGIALKDRPVFSVQHHPEASPGPTDSLYLFDRFAKMMDV